MDSLFADGVYPNDGVDVIAEYGVTSLTERRRRMYISEAAGVINKALLGAVENHQNQNGNQDE